MSFFVLLRDADAPANLEEFCASFETQFPGPRDLRFGDTRLVLFGNQSGDPLARHEAENGDSVAALGSLIYKGVSSPGCLPQLLTEFHPQTFTWQGLIGAHLVMVIKAGNAHIFADGLGASRIYTNPGHTVWSNSFLALCALGGSRELDTQACYEYVIGGSVYGDKTLLRGVSALPANNLLTIDKHGAAEVTQRPSPISDDPVGGQSTLDAIADHHVRQLQQVFEPIAQNYGDRIRLSFSGGFDSRLMLANLLKFGAKPTLFVYGDDEDEDVRIARLICKAEGLPLECIDKSKAPPLPPDSFAAETEKNLAAFDGWKVETPLFDFGADRRDRISRHVEGQVPLNGSLGEIYRNFFYIPDRPSSTAAVISTFYSRYDPRALTARFDEREYRSAMALAMRDAIGTTSDELTRSQVEELYPKFRGRFWTGRDASNNQRFGPMFFPYLEHAAISNTAKVPIRFKDLGYLQGRMIARISPRLAGYPSDYGFALDGPRPLKYRFKTWLGTQRPAALRKLSFRMTHRTPQPRTGPLTPEYLSTVIDLDFPIMRQLFNIDAVNSATQYGLIATLEYLAQRFNLDIPDG